MTQSYCTTVLDREQFDSAKAVWLILSLLNETYKPDLPFKDVYSFLIVVVIEVVVRPQCLIDLAIKM